jgi:hypothetical protein
MRPITADELTAVTGGDGNPPEYSGTGTTTQRFCFEKFARQPAHLAGARGPFKPARTNGTLAEHPIYRSGDQPGSATWEPIPNTSYGICHYTIGLDKIR